MSGNTADLVRRPQAARRLVRAARRRAGVTQRELAQRAGVPQATVGRIESGAVQPKVETLLLLLNAAGYELSLRPRRGAGVDRTLMTPADEAPTARAERLDEVGRAAASLHRASM